MKIKIFGTVAVIVLAAARVDGNKYGSKRSLIQECTEDQPIYEEVCTCLVDLVTQAQLPYTMKSLEEVIEKAPWRSAKCGLKAL